MNKEFKTWIILNHKNGSFRCIKKKGKLKSNEIGVELNLNIDVPEEVTLKATGNITLSSSKVNDIILEELDC